MSVLIERLKQAIEFDERAAFDNANIVYGDQQGLSLDDMTEQARWQCSRLQPVLLAMVEIVSVAIMERSRLDRDSDMAQALSSLRKALDGVK